MNDKIELAAVRDENKRLLRQLAEMRARLSVIEGAAHSMAEMLRDAKLWHDAETRKDDDNGTL